MAAALVGTKKRRPEWPKPVADALNERRYAPLLAFSKRSSSSLPRLTAASSASFAVFLPDHTCCISSSTIVRTWRELARYKGAELAKQEGEKPLFRLAQVMEELFEQWDDVKRFPQFKAEN